MKGMSRLIQFVALAMLVAAVVQELRKPAAERTWCGRVAGLVPYDLRLPTLGRFLSAAWNAEDGNVLVGTPFGVGWTINFRALNNLLRGGTDGS
jgi:hypothetical protein